ncbi:MAG: hypothetical protein EOP06_08165 [Proteobacteria bacterium]|nr:MAG: hypothetical protein EOP06_08165 [Pseudomonadota bacterium]
MLATMEHLDVYLLVRDLDQFGPVWDRPLGRHCFPLVEKALCELPEHQALNLFFSTQCRASSSFLDEVVVELAHRLTQKVYKEKGLVVTGLSDSEEFDLDGALSVRWMKAHREGTEFTAAVIFVIQESPREWRLVGHLEKTLHEALVEVGRASEITAAELAAALNLDTKNASTRLKRLHQRALVGRQERRSEAGREYVYFFWA